MATSVLPSRTSFTRFATLFFSLGASAFGLSLPVSMDTSTTPTRTSSTVTIASGKATTLMVSPTRDALVYFDLGGLPNTVTPATVVSARLRFYVAKVTKPGSLSVLSVLDSWSEDAAGPAPSTNAAPLITLPADKVASKRFIVIDATAAVKAWLANPASNRGLALIATDASPTLTATFGAKEGPGIRQPAELEIEINASAGVYQDNDPGTGVIDGHKIAPASIANTQLATPSITVLPGSGLSGGGTVSLGGSITLNSNATSSNTGGAIVSRDANGDFAARAITASFSGNGAGLTNLPASALAGAVAIANGGTGATTAPVALANLGGASLTASNDFLNNFTVTAATAAAPVNTVRAATGQTGSLLELRNEANTIVASIDPAGNLSATNFSGNGGSITGLNGGNISVGSVTLSQLASNSVDAARIVDGTITNADLSSTAAIADTKLATLTTAGKVANSATTATQANTADSIVLRDASGNFSAGGITLSGSIDLSATLSVNSGVVRQGGAAVFHTFAPAAQPQGSLFAGYSAGNFTMTGTQNTGIGYAALGSNTSGGANTALGSEALSANNSGAGNTAAGYAALFQNTIGTANTAVGKGALMNSTAASYNIAIGSGAGASFGVGSYNIWIGHVGVSGDSGIIRIGTAASHTDTFLTGIIHGNGSALTNIPAASITGTITAAQLASSLNLAGTTSLGLGLSLPATTSASSGVISIGGGPFIHTFGTSNTFIGAASGNFTMTGSGNSALGRNALAANSAGSSNLAVGAFTLSSNTNGSSNTAVGDSALRSNTIGDYNTAVGFQALFSNTTPGANTAVGYQALRSNITGDSNVAMGYLALTAATTANDNVGIGGLALTNTTTGRGNTAVGRNTLRFNVTGTGNVAIGDSALSANLVSDNTAVGTAALSGNTTGTANVAVGQNALSVAQVAEGNSALGSQALRFTTSGNFNTGAGALTLRENTTGSTNSAFGYGALFSNTTANNNSAVGYEALYANTTGAGNTALGAQALIANSTGSFNTASGFSALNANLTGGSNAAFGVEALKSNTTGDNNSAFGFRALTANTVSHNNTAVGLNALLNSTGSNNIAIGANAGITVTTGSNNVHIGNPGFAGESNAVRLGNPSTVFTYLFGTVVEGTLTGATDAPTHGLIRQRVNSTTAAAGSVVARTNVLTLERDGSNGGFLIRYPANPPKQTIAATGITATGTPVTFYTSLNNPATAGTVTLWTDAQNVAYFEVKFGDTYNANQQTSVEVSRFPADSYWVGHMVSTFSQ